MRRNGRGGFNSGPALLSDQLSDLDRELQLLKRKREMFEQQQQMLAGGQQFGRQRQFDYEQPAQSYNQQSYKQGPALNSDRPFSQLYDDGPGTYSNNYRRPFAKKRQASDTDWQSNAPPKRFYKPGNRSTSQRGSKGPNPMSKRSLQLLTRPEPFVNPMEPLMNVQPKPAVAPRFNEPFVSKPFRNDFRPTKVTKAKNTFQPKLPNKINSNPVEKRKILVANAAELVKQDEDFVLRADKVPNVQMTGRLELALGQILKDLKLRYWKPPYSELFVTQVRKIKQIIRERIKSVMLGKVVSHIGDIIRFYRAKYPNHTDRSIMASAMSHEKRANKEVSAAIVEEADVAEKYFKDNMKKMLEIKLTDVFNKVYEIYKEEYKNKDTSVSTDKVVEEAEHKEEELKDVEEENPEESTANLESETNVKSAEEQETDESGKTEEVKVMDESIDQVESQQESSAEATDAKYAKILESFLEREVPLVLPRYKYLFIKMFNLDRQYRTTKANLLARVRHGLVFKCDPNTVEDKDLTEASNAEDKDKEVNKAPFTALPYYVKVIGRPYLPKRKLMRDFLQEFNPLSIKKHKDIPHLLFVGLGTKADFDRILKANDTYIGTNRIIIKISESIKKKEDNDDDDVQIIENTTANSADISLTEELDNQISDLLSSIKKDEENKDVKNEENTTKGNNEENSAKEDNAENATKGDNAENATKGDNKKNSTKEDNEENATKGDSEENATEGDIEVKSAEENNEENATEGDNEVKATEENATEGDTEVKATEENNEERGDEEIVTDKDSEVTAMEVNDEEKATEVNIENETGSKNTTVGTDSYEKVLDEMLEDSKTEEDDKAQPKEEMKQKSEETKEDGVKKANNEDVKSGNKEAAKAVTPMRTSARLANATPSTVRTRRASKLS